MSKWWKKQHEVAGWYKAESYKRDEYVEAATKVEPSSPMIEPKADYSSMNAEPYRPYRPYVQPELVPWTPKAEPAGLETVESMRAAYKNWVESASSLEAAPVEKREKEEAKEKAEYVNYW